MKGFDEQAAVYDSAALVQAEVAKRLAARISGAPRRILEIGCGTGLLSEQLAMRFPEAELVLTDIAPKMLVQAKRRLRQRAYYGVMDGQWPDAALGSFDLIASSLAFQWFDDLPGAMERLSNMLAPGGVLAFATLGAESFAEWRRAHEEMGLPCGLRDYVRADEFPWPQGFACGLGVDIVDEFCPDGRSFVRGMKKLGAAQSPAAHRPVGAGRFRALLERFSGGFTARYQLLFGEIRHPDPAAGGAKR
jgi:malonyl-CoA O-methyltransferase